MPNKPLIIRPAISGGGYVARGGWLISHEELLEMEMIIPPWKMNECRPCKGTISKGTIETGVT